MKLIEYQNNKTDKKLCESKKAKTENIRHEVSKTQRKAKQKAIVTKLSKGECRGHKENKTENNR